MGFIEALALDSLLTRWKKNPKLPRKEISRYSHHQSGPKGNEPFTRAEIARMMARFKQIAPSSYYKLFPN